MIPRSILIPIQHEQQRKLPYSSLYYQMIYRKEEVLPKICKPDKREQIAKLISYSENQHKRLQLEYNIPFLKKSFSTHRPQSAANRVDFTLEPDFYLRYQIVCRNVYRSNYLLLELAKINNVHFHKYEY